MKILLDCRLISERPTGISRYSEKMLNYYIEKYGCDNVNALVNEFHDKIKCEQIITKLKPFNIIHWFLFPLWIRNLNYKWLISFHYSGLAFKARNLKSIITVHDLMYELVPGFFSSTFKNLVGKFYYRFIVKSSLMNASKIISVSDTTRDDLVKLYNVDSFVSGEGIFLNAFANSEILNKLELESKKYYLYIGNNRPHKNIDFLKECFLKMDSEQRQDCRLVLVGHHGNSCDRILYPGIVSDEELVGLYQGAKAFVFPSKYEGFGLPILEALDNYCPIIASDIPAFREFSNKNIAYFKIGDEMGLTYLLSQKHTFDQDSARIIINKYSWAQTYENLDIILGDELCEK